MFFFIILCFTLGWVANIQNRYQYIQVDLEKPQEIYGIRIAGAAKYKAKVDTFFVLISLDGSKWTRVLPNVSFKAISYSFTKIENGIETV